MRDSIASVCLLASLLFGVLLSAVWGGVLVWLVWSAGSSMF